MRTYAKRIIALTLCLALFLTFNIISVCETSEAENASEVSTGYYRGDADLNGSIDMKDVLKVRKYLAGLLVIMQYWGDANGDDFIDMKDVLYLRQYMAGMVDKLIPLTPEQLTTQSTIRTSATLPTKYPIDKEDPVVNFIEGSNASLGIWWWAFNMEDSDEDLCMDLCAKNQVTEIYYYCAANLLTTTGRELIHGFVQKAMANNIRVSALFDNQDVVKSGNDSFTKAVNNYKKYLSEYPEDALYGLHVDVEPSKSDKYSDTTMRRWTQNYVNNFLVAQVAPAREEGIYVELDLGAGWNSRSMDLTYSGTFKPYYAENENPEPNEDGTYTLSFYDAVANNCDVMCMMSYRDTAKKIADVAYEGRRYANKAATKIVFGVETGNANEGDQVDFYGESKEILYTELSRLLLLIEKNEPVGGYGFAIHHIASWYRLPKVIEEEAEA